MQNGQRPGIPLIGALKMMPVEPFHIQDLGWFDAEKLTSIQQLGHVLVILITLIMPKPQNVQFKVKEYAEENDLLVLFIDKDPATIKALKEQKLLMTEGTKQ